MFKDGERVVGEGITLEPGFAVFERLHRRKNQRVPVEDIDYVIVREGVRTGTAVGGVIAAGGVVSLSLAESSNSLPEAVGYWKLGLVGLGIGGVVALLSEAHKPRQAYVLEGCQDIGSMGWYENN